MPQKWLSKFEIKPGRWVFVPTADAIQTGNEIKKQIKSKWKPPSYFYHLRAGGHVAAIKSHTAHSNFIHVDIQDFFGSINKTRITRCLKKKFNYLLAREWAQASTVSHPSDKERSIIPYGFVQSQIIASICLAESALGTFLEKTSKLNGVAISVYVDDVVISADDKSKCELLLAKLKKAVERSRFQINAKKEQGPSNEIVAFNIVLSNKSIAIQESKFREFKDALGKELTEMQRNGIISYVLSINSEQAKNLG